MRGILGNVRRTEPYHRLLFESFVVVGTYLPWVGADRFLWRAPRFVPPCRARGVMVWVIHWGIPIKGKLRVWGAYQQSGVRTLISILRERTGNNGGTLPSLRRAWSRLRFSTRSELRS